MAAPGSGRVNTEDFYFLLSDDSTGENATQHFDKDNVLFLVLFWSPLALPLILPRVLLRVFSAISSTSALASVSAIGHPASSHPQYKKSTFLTAFGSMVYRATSQSKRRGN